MSPQRSSAGTWENEIVLGLLVSAIHDGPERRVFVELELKRCPRIEG
jgi:hypothetical protein